MKISYPGYWALTGGDLPKGESFRQSAIRELEEEAGYRSKEPIHFMTELYFTPTGKLVRSQRFLDLYDGKQEISCLEGRRLDWKTVEQIGGLKMVPTHRYAAKRALMLSKKSGFSRDRKA